MFKKRCDIRLIGVPFCFFADVRGISGFGKGLDPGTAKLNITHSDRAPGTETSRDVLRDESTGKAIALGAEFLAQLSPPASGLQKTIALHFGEYIKTSIQFLILLLLFPFSFFLHQN